MTHETTLKGETMKIRTTSRTATCDPITYEATATCTINGIEFMGDYHGTENECRKEVKEAAIIELKSRARKAGCAGFWCRIGYAI